MHPVVFMFSGQGSQYYQMGNGLFTGRAVFRKWMRRLDGRARDLIGESILERLYDANRRPGDPFVELRYSNPALFMQQYALARELSEAGIEPDLVLGASLGEFVSGAVSGILSVEEGLAAVIQLAEDLERYCSPGGMLAILESPDLYDDTPLLRDNSTLVGVNFDGHFVVSGDDDALGAITDFLLEKDINYLLLPVSKAFHSRRIDSAGPPFTAFLKQKTFAPPGVPFISCSRARRMTTLSSDYFWKVVRRPILFQQTIQTLENDGQPLVYVDLGPSGTLANFVKYNLGRNSASRCLSILTPFGHDEEHLEKALEHLAPKTVSPVGREPRAPRKAGGRREEAGRERRTEEGGESVDGKRAGRTITASSLGGDAFKKEYNLEYAYLAGGMFRGIASPELVIAMGRAGMMGFLGTGGMEMEAIEHAIRRIREALSGKPYKSYGVNFPHVHDAPEVEEALVDLCLNYDVAHIEASAFMGITPALARYRLKGLRRGENGVVVADNRVMAKLSRPEVAKAFLRPAPERIVKKLLREGKISEERAALSEEIPMADAICVEADSGGQTDGGAAYALMPAMRELRNEITRERGYKKRVHMGAAGGVGTPDAAAAVFTLGADFILTGSINQCTVEAGTSDAVKDLLQQMNVQDTDYAPAGGMFELGGKVQVLRKGVFFPARANKLRELHQRYGSLEEIDEKTKKQLQERVFKRSFDDIWEETRAFMSGRDPEGVERAERSPRHKMALVFKWWLGRTVQAAIAGEEDEKVNFQVHTGPALGAFNQWVLGTDLEEWRNRRVSDIGRKLMEETARLLNRRYTDLTRGRRGRIPEKVANY